MSFEEVVEFLSTPATYGPGIEVEKVATHAAVVFLAGDDAYKVKRPVRYPYLDFSTLRKREAMLRRELELNRPAAPEIYLGLVPVTRREDGGLALGGGGEVVEWCLHMRRFPPGAELSQVAAREGISRALGEEIGRSIAEYHARAEIRDADGHALMRAIADELRDGLSQMEDVFGEEALARFHGRVAGEIAAHQALLTQRGQNGYVRRGHGDLHLGNIVLIKGRPVPFDALEFSERLATLDVLYDLAFVIMDLLHRGFAPAANGALGAYLYRAREPDHFDALALLPLFLGLRAGIRAMVSVEAARLAEGKADSGARIAEARAYLADALAHLAPAAPRLVAIGGYSGTGKTTVARKLAPEIGPAPGAVHLRSDLERKAMFGVAPEVRLPPEAYSRAVGERVYARLFDQAGRIIKAGHSVIVDAVFARAEERAALEGIARRSGVRFAGLWLEADPETLLARVDARRGDASDADSAVVRRQLASGAAAREWVRIEAGGSLREVTRRARAAL